MPATTKRPRASSDGGDDRSTKTRNTAASATKDNDAIENARLHKLEKGFGREINRMVSESKENSVTFHHFRFETALRGVAQEPEELEEPVIEWMDTTPRLALSEDGIPLIFHLPDAMKGVSTTILEEELKTFVDVGFKGKLPLKAGADGKTCDQKKSYIQRAGQIAGLFKLVRAWHAIGHSHQKPTPSRDMLKTGAGFCASIELIRQLHLVSHRVNCLIEAADPGHYAQLQQLHAAASKAYPFYDSLAYKDPLLMEGRELMYNRRTPLHVDKSDPKCGWAVLVVVGPFTGGALWIPCLNLRMKYTRGTIIMLRGRILPHEVEAFSSGQRIAIAHFTHADFWRKFGMEPTASVVV